MRSPVMQNKSLISRALSNAMNTVNGVTIANARFIRKAIAPTNGETYSNRSINITMISKNIIKPESIEQSMNEREETYKDLYENAPYAYFSVAKDGSIIRCNCSAEYLVGRKRNEIIGRPAIELYSETPHGKEKALRIFEQFKAGETINEEELQMQKADGTPVWVSLTVNALRDPEGNIVESRSMAVDITEHKKSEKERVKLEAQLLQAQKMEAIGQLAGGFAHDFNNILTTILGYGKLLDDEIDKNSTQGNYVHHILASARRGANLIKALLAFSRKKDISPLPVNLNEVVQELEGFLDRIIGKDIELSTVLSNKDLVVIANSGLIEQVLMNLATNARDAMPDGGYLIIRTEMMVLDYTSIREHGYIRPGEYAIVSFHDSGNGMDEETQVRIFEPFFTTKEVGKGTGLGLSMVYGIVKHHNGHINVYSEPGKGTTFKIYLPMIESVDEEVNDIDSFKTTREIDTILIADDNVKVRKHIKEVLSEFGYRVVEAEDGEDALRVFYDNEDSIDLLIFDIMMPHKNGPEAYNEIKQSHPDIKIIFISGCNTDVLYKEKILEEGLDFVSKPLLPEYFLTKIREVLNK